jgi:hypothetical protein
MHWNGQIHFGDGMDTYSMSYYDDILEHQCVPLEQYGAGELIQRFEQWIDEGYYIIVDMNLEKDVIQAAGWRCRPQRECLY